MNTKSGGYNDRIISLDIYEDNFKIETGIEKFLYRILELTKSRADNMESPTLNILRCRKENDV